MGRKSDLEKLNLEHQSQQEGGPTSKYIHMPDLPVDKPQGTLLKNKSRVPFACARCMYPLQVLHTHNLNKGHDTPVICFGTCYEAIRGNSDAMNEIGITSPTQIGNVYAIPDRILADAFGLDLVTERPKKDSTNASNNLDEGTDIREGTEEASVLASSGLHESSDTSVRNGEPGLQPAA